MGRFKMAFDACISTTQRREDMDFKIKCKLFLLKCSLLSHVENIHRVCTFCTISSWQWHQCNVAVIVHAGWNTSRFLQAINAVATASGSTFKGTLQLLWQEYYTGKLLFYQSRIRHSDYIVTGQWRCSHCWQLPAARWLSCQWQCSHRTAGS